MNQNSNDEIDGLTQKFKKAGNAGARDDLWAELFPKLRKIAQNRIAAAGRRGREAPTEIVNELYPALQRALENPDNHFESRAHFFAYAAQAMRRHLAAMAKKQVAEELFDDDFAVESASPALGIAISNAIEKLSKRFPRAVQAYELREYAGHSYEEILELMKSDYRTKALLAADLTMVRKLLVEALTADE